MSKVIELQTSWSTEASEFLANELKHKSVVVQYGCSSVTELVCNANNIHTVLAVEANESISDNLYESTKNKEKLHLMHSNIGKLNADGQPIDSSHYEHYHQYMILPWALSEKYAATPDLVIIDGHFKVASFLYSLICAQEGTTVIFNQYFNSTIYKEIENFCTVERRFGNTAEFIVRKNYFISEITAMIAKYSVVSD